jgi:Transposase DDE domain
MLLACRRFAPERGAGQDEGQPSRLWQAQSRRLGGGRVDTAKTDALELARVYHERWQVEAVFDELKTHLLNRRRTLRSKTPGGVRKEFYGWVLAHYAVCWLMQQTASEYRLRQRELSFTGHMNLIKRKQPQSGALPPDCPRLRKRAFDDILREGSTKRCESSRTRSNPRMVKHRTSGYASQNPAKPTGTRPNRTPVIVKPKPLYRWMRYRVTH